MGGGGSAIERQGNTPMAGKYTTHVGTDGSDDNQSEESEEQFADKGWRGKRADLYSSYRWVAKKRLTQNIIQFGQRPIRVGLH